MSTRKHDPKRGRRPARQVPARWRGWLLAAVVAVGVAAVIAAGGGYVLERWTGNPPAVAAQGEAVPRFTLETTDGDYVVADGSRAAEVLFFSFPG